MRIEQPKHLDRLYRESVLKNARLPIGKFIFFVAFFTVLSLIAARHSEGPHVELRQWIILFGTGPFVFLMSHLAMRADCIGPRYAEIRGDHVHLGFMGYTFRPKHLLLCRLEPDNNFPEVYRLCFCFRPFRFAVPKGWSMMVENKEEAEAFRRRVEEMAGVAPDRGPSPG